MRGLPDSIVSASWLDDGLVARIRVNANTDYWVQPLPSQFKAQGRGQHLMYSSADVQPHGKICGLDLIGNARPEIDSGAGIPNPSAQKAAGNVAELGIDADFEYFQRYGSSGAVQSRITAVIDTMNLQYETEVDISHTITAIVVRTTSNDPYFSTNASTILDEFMNEWTSNQGSIQRDVAQLFTGKEVDGGTIGIAYLGVICNSSFGFGMVQSDFNNNFACATDLSAHEMGHNWNADHCNCTSNTMNPFITCSNTFHPSATIPDIVAHRDSRGCLDGGNPPGEATSVNVASIVPGTVKANKGRKFGRVTITIVDDNGAPVAGATVTGDFSGPDFNESGLQSASTNANGQTSITTSGTAKGKVNFTFCVTNVSATLPYVAGDNTETCDSL